MAKARKRVTKNEIPEEVKKYIELVDIVRKSNRKEKVNIAFEEIQKMLDSKIKQISYKLNIPGFSINDVYQEALFALRFKAIKDYDQERGSGEGPYPFDKFAILCIRRHLFTKRKTVWQNKQKVLSTSISLNQNQNSDSEDGDMVFLIDILPKTEGDVVDAVAAKEFCINFRRNLIESLSSFEKEVLYLYLKRYSYKQMSALITEKRKRLLKPGEKIGVKSIDNTLSRIKKKARILTEDKKGPDTNAKKSS